MKLQSGATSLDITLIDIDHEARQRQSSRGGDKRLDTSGLEQSIALRGLLNPIIVSGQPNGRFRLEAGERRLTACRNLGHAKILARRVSDLSPVEAQIIELEENIKRQDLEWQDLCRGVAGIHRLYTQLDEDWTQTRTAEECCLTVGTVNTYLQVHEFLGDPRIAQAGTVREALNIIQRRDQRQAGEALQALLDAPEPHGAEPPPPPALTEADQLQIKAMQELGKPLPSELEAKRREIWRAEHQTRAVPAAQPPESILQASFLDWAPQYSGPKFNLVHCDFPYGVELFSGPQGRGAEGSGPGVGYRDSRDTYWALAQCLCDNFDRIASVSCHLMFWLSADHQIVHQTRQLFAQHAPSLKFYNFQLIWVKSDNAGISSDADRRPRHVYEACLLASRGDRNLARVKADAYAAPTDKKLHPSTKPEPMLRHFMEMLVDETTSLLDPTCGSGAALRAAESLGARQVLGLEIDPQYLAPARLALKQARQKRAAEKGGLGL